MPPRVLYVDDHADTCDLIRIVLAQAGYEVSVATCASDALAVAGREEFDVYILNNRLPDSTGLELLGRLREFDPQTPAVFYSGEGFEAGPAEGVGGGRQCLRCEAGRACGAGGCRLPPRREAESASHVRMS